MQDYYCSVCGEKLEHRVIKLAGYDRYTGKPIWRSGFICSKKTPFNFHSKIMGYSKKVKNGTSDTLVFEKDFVW